MHQLTIRVAAAFVLALSSALVWAQHDEARVQACLEQAAQQFSVDLVALQVIRELEGGKIGSVSENSNGSVDLGPMQVNSVWEPVVLRAGATLELLRDDPCVNAYVAAWIFQQEVRSSRSMAQAIAQYHSRTPEFQHRYLSRARDVVLRQLAREATGDHNQVGAGGR